MDYSRLLFLFLVVTARGGIASVSMPQVCVALRLSGSLASLRIRGGGELSLGFALFDESDYEQRDNGDGRQHLRDDAFNVRVEAKPIVGGHAGK